MEEHDWIKETLMKGFGLFDAVPDAIVITDRNGRITWVNAETDRLFGYLREELIGQPVEILLPERFREADLGHQTGYQQAPRKRPMGAGLDLAGRRKDGSEFSVEIGLNPIETEEGRCILSIIRDITERKRIEARLHANEERFRLLTENAQDIIYLYRIVPAPRFEYVSPAVETILEYTPEEFYADPYLGLKVIHPDDAPLLKNLVVSLPTLENAIVLRWMRKDGTVVWMEQRNTPLYDEQGTLIAIEGVARDITEQKRHEELLMAQKGLLEEKVREMDDFIHVVSHDLKEPLRGIEAFSGFLEEDYGLLLDSQGRQHIAFIKNAAVRMKDLIHDLLAIASISGKTPPLQAVDLNRIIARIENDLQFAIEEKGAKIDRSISFPTVLCDPVRIGEVFKNLVSNAIKFNTGPAPRVELGFRKEGEVHLFWVKDNGIGIDPRYHERIFDLFERLHPQEAFEGTGAGLAICKKVIEGYGGKIWIESELGKGSAFFFTLPNQQGPREDPRLPT
ncbi:MAG: PAS domain S-box protein [Candidatus Manganitrophaceae bacterium]